MLMQPQVPYVNELTDLQVYKQLMTYLTALHRLAQESRLAEACTRNKS